MGRVMPVTVKLSAREVELVEAVAALEGSSRSGLIRAVIMERVRERLAPLLDLTDPAGATVSFVSLPRWAGGS
jgi:hypothetical protein